MNIILRPRVAVAAVKAVAIVAGLLTTTALERAGMTGMSAGVAGAALLVFATPGVVMAQSMVRMTRNG